MISPSAYEVWTMYNLLFLFEKLKTMRYEQRMT